MQLIARKSLMATFLLTVVLCAVNGFATTIALVQSASVQGTGVGSLSQTFPTANAAGNFIVAFVRMSTTSQTVAISDSLGNVYSDAVSQAQTMDGHQVHIFYTANVKGGANTVKAAFSATNNHPYLAVFEYSGVSTAAPLDQTAHAQGTSGNANAGPMPATTSANELVFAGLGMPASSTTTATAGSGFTMRQQDTPQYGSRANTEDLTATTIANFSGSFGLNSTTNWSSVVASFKAAASTAAPPTATAPSITTASLPGGMQNTSYSANFAATSGTPPYTWLITSGSLPSGLTLNATTGAITGTPTGSGTSTFTAQVKDANSLTASKTFSIAVAAAPVATTGIGLVQSNSVQRTGTASISSAFLGANTAGNLIIAFVRASTTTQTVAVSDTLGNVYNDAVSQAQSFDGHQVHIFYAANVKAGANTVTATFSGTNNYPFLAIYEYSGLGQLDKAAKAQGTNSTPSTACTAATVAANELVFAGMGLPASSTVGFSAGSGYTMEKQQMATGGSRAANEDRQLTASTTCSGNFSLSGSANWSMVLATFAPASTPVPPAGPAPIAITTSSLPGGSVGAAYSASLQASGGTPPYSWSVVSGQLPSGISLSTSGVLSGTPTVAGSSYFSIMAKDSASSPQAATQAESISVAAASSSTMQPPAGYSASQMIFEEKFNTSTLNTNVWNPWLGNSQYGRWNDQGNLPSPYSGGNCPNNSCASQNSIYYTDPYPSGYSTNTTGNHLVTGDGLHCIATPSSYFSSKGYSWGTCTLSTFGKLTLPNTGTTYIQFHAKMPDSRYGAWGGLWFLDGGAEIDLQESGTCSGCQGSATANRILAMHNWNDGSSQVKIDTGVDLSAGFHTYAMEISPGNFIKMYFDGVLQHTWTSSVPTGKYQVLIDNEIANPNVASGWHTVADPNHPGPFELVIDDIQIFNH